MKHQLNLAIICLLTCMSALALTPSTLQAQYQGWLRVFDDQYGTDCNLTVDYDTGSGLYVGRFYVIQNQTIGTTSSSFRVIETLTTLPDCTRLGWTSPFQLTMGEPYAGIYVGYVGCHTGDVLLLTLTLACTSEPPWDCSKVFSVAGYPGAAFNAPEVWDCHLEPESEFVCGFSGMFGPGGNCPCNVVHGGPWGPQYCPVPVAVEPSTWGAIKALYH